VAPGDHGDGFGGEADDDAVEEGGGIGEGVGVAVAVGDVADDPDALVEFFRGGELGDEEFEHSGLVWAGVVGVVEDVVDVPEVGVQGDDFKALGGGVGVGAKVGFDAVGGGAVDPFVLEPEGRDEVVVPGGGVGGVRRDHFRE